MRMADQRLGDGVDPVAGDVLNLEAERGFADAVDSRPRVAPFVVEKGLTVGDEELEIANLGSVDRRIVDLRQDAGGNGVPNPARR
jgi:hypothetical protein